MYWGKDMDRNLTWLTEAGLDIKSGIDYTGGADKYISAIRRFYSNYEKNRDKVIEYYSAKDYESYMITVHALKSNAKMIGAMDLSKAFENLENAAREKNGSILEAKTDQVLFSYKELIDKLKPVEQFGEVQAVDEISGQVARQTADKLLEALDDFDDDLSKELACKLSGYPFRLTQKDMLKRAIEYVDDFMYDEAADIIREISVTIE
ncbi:Hpt domain-containing protein [Pseudobutyrivibrio sp.]